MLASDEKRVLEGLTETQRQLLRLVAQGVVRSKPLAQAMRERGLGLGPGTIKTYLYQAAKTLDANTREAAAARFVALEARLGADSGGAAGLSIGQSGELAGELTPQPVAVPPKSLLFRVAIAVKHFFTGLPVGGQPHAFTKGAVILQILRTALIGMTGLTAVVLFVFGFLKAFSYPTP